MHIALLEICRANLSGPEFREVKDYSDESVKGDKKKKNVFDGEADTRASQKTVKDSDFGTTNWIVCVRSRFGGAGWLIG